MPHNAKFQMRIWLFSSTIKLLLSLIGGLTLRNDAPDYASNVKEKNEMTFKEKLRAAIVAILTVVMSVGTVSAAPAMAAANYADKELSRAVNLGFGTYRSDNPTVTYAQFMTMLDRTVGLANPSKLAEWKAKLPQARKSNETIYRYQAMFAAYIAAEACGKEYVIGNGGFWLSVSGSPVYKWNDEIFPNASGGEKLFDWDRCKFDYFQGYLTTEDRTKYTDNFYTAAIYWWVSKQQSLFSNKLIFGLQPELGTNCLRQYDKLTYNEALLAVLRIYESVLPQESDRWLTAADIEILNKAYARKQAIINSPTTVTVTGAKYYVSAKGNDSNDGLSPDTPWLTLGRVTKADLKPGDGVFFKRGDIWRFQTLTCQEGVTYSAYGEGEKPRFYGSPENGAGAEKWSLVPGTANVWVYYKPMRDCGAVVFNDGESYAQKEYLYWNGKEYRTFSAFSSNAVLGKEPFTPKDLKNLRFYNDIDYSGVGGKDGDIQKPIGDQDQDSYYIRVLNYNYLEGKLYLRCDEGNPGQVYNSIEFCMDRDDGHAAMIICPERGVTLDNLCVKYGAHSIWLDMGDHWRFVNNNFSYGARNTLQNCEIGWIAGTTERFVTSGTTIYSGDGPDLWGINNAAINNYVYECQDCGIVVEECPTYNMFPIEKWNSVKMVWADLTIKGNLIEKCNGGICFNNWEQEAVEGHYFHNGMIEDNYVLYSGYGHSGKRSRDLWGVNAYGRAGVDNLFNYSLFFALMDEPDANDGIYVRNNIFYLSGNVLVQSAIPQKYYPVFSGNTFVQNNYGRLAIWKEPSGDKVAVNAAEPEIVNYVKNVIGDKTAKVFATSGAPTLIKFSDTQKVGDKYILPLSGVNTITKISYKIISGNTVASITSKGTVTALKSGTAKIQVTFGNGVNKDIVQTYSLTVKK